MKKMTREWIFGELETFIDKIKDGKINKDTIPKDGHRVNAFLLCLLDKEERKKLEHKDFDFIKTFKLSIKEKADVPVAEWKASESNMKFSKFECWRRTYFIDASINSSDLDSDSCSDLS